MGSPMIPSYLTLADFESQSQGHLYIVWYETCTVGDQIHIFAGSINLDIT